MTRFDETMTLDHLADRDELDGTLIAKLAVAVAVMHERAPAANASAWLAAVEPFIAGNTAAFRDHGDLFPDQAVAELDRDFAAALARLRPLLAMRGEQNLIRRGHGDLHLGNIALIDGEPVAFDALEFDPVVASGDVLYDLAFLLMDLVERGLERAANGVLNGYFAAARRSADDDGIAALPFFMSLRAAIRANVTAARRDLAKVLDKDDIAQSAKRYFDLARTLLAPARPSVVCTGGLSGTGKTVLARALAPLLRAEPGSAGVSLRCRAQSALGVAETARLPPDAYRAEVSDKIYRILNDKAARVARAGHSVIVDAVFAKPHERAAIEAAAESGAGGFSRTVSCGRSADASEADRHARPRCLRCRRQGGTSAG